MRIPLTDKFWEEVNLVQQNQTLAYMTQDSLCEVIAKSDGGNRSLIFKSTRRMDCQDFPEEKKAYIDNDHYFDTVEFEIISSDQVLDQLAAESKEHKCKCNCHSERNVTKDLVLKLAAALEDSYLGKIDEQCTYLEPAVKSLLNEIIQFKRDEDYKKANVFDKIRSILKQYEKEYKKCKTSAESDLFRDHAFRRILEELADFGLFATVEALYP